MGGTRENAQWLRAFTVLEKDWVQFSAPISGGSQLPVTLVPGNSTSWASLVICTHTVNINSCKQVGTHGHTKNK